MRSMRFIAQAFVLVAVMLGVGACNIDMGDWSRAHYERTVELQHAMADGANPGRLDRQRLHRRRGRRR